MTGFVVNMEVNSTNDAKVSHNISHEGVIGFSVISEVISTTLVTKVNDLF
jgi:hypothetical protein